MGVTNMNKDERYIWKLKRKGRDIILKDISEYVGYSISMVSQWENGQKEMAQDRINLYKEYIENKEI